MVTIGFGVLSAFQHRQTLLERDQAHRVTEILMSMFEITDPAYLHEARP